MSEHLIETEVEQARPEDAEAIAALLERNRKVATLLLQPVEQVRAQVDEFVLIRGPGRVRGCAQLRRHRPTIHEIMAVAVDPVEHGRGIGSACVRACVARALEERATLIWLATTSPEFFARLGFVPIPMRTIPAAILLGKLGVVVRQPLRRWSAAVLGHQQFMRWPKA
ncbi:MAG: GNAT family N-acetyltransferase [Enhygromyxa sp.]